MKVANRPAIRRFLVIDRELRAGHYPTADRLAELTESNHQTVRRDLNFLRDEYHAPIGFNRQHNGWEYTEPTYRLPAVLLTAGDLVAILFAASVVQQWQGTPFEDDFHRALHKLTEFLPEEISVQWSTLEQAHSFRQSVTTLHDVATFRQLAAAVLHRRQLAVRYWTASRNDENERTIDPWHLACLDGSFYLIGYCHTRRKVLTFAPNRIRSLTETGSTFCVPADFHVAQVLSGSFKVIAEADQPLTKVHLRFTGTATRYIPEKIWHPSQQLEVRHDGTVDVTLWLNSLIEVRRWILSWGRECEVLEPLSLRDDIHHEARGILAQSPAAALPRIASKTTRAPRRDQKTG